MNNHLQKSFTNSFKSISTKKKYKTNRYITKTINIEIEYDDFIKYQTNNKKLDLHVYNFIKTIKFEFEVFREAYINQRKKYRLLKAYQDLINNNITDDMYDIIEDECIITINEHDEYISLNAVYTFLKRHENYTDNYDINELSEILGIDYNQVSKILKGRSKVD